MKKSLNYIIFLLLVLVAAYFWQLNMQDAPNENNNNSGDVINLVFSFDNDEPIQLEYPYSISSPGNLFVVTKNIAQEQNWAFNFENYDGLGVLITQIGEKENGQDQKYWQYTVNGITPLVSVDNFYPKANDTIEWVFRESEM
ncbi:hypothetical protein C0580_04495 [Candidatus Parcubacteria bacterium]|nr:MAG: hypothetical protein C0580_04495 [Candidatus Parcubacteria bacterium]